MSDMSDIHHRLLWMIREAWLGPWAEEDETVSFHLDTALLAPRYAQWLEGPSHSDQIEMLHQGFMAALFGFGKRPRRTRRHGPFGETLGLLKPYLPPPQPYERN